ncbi:MAG: hypothetical protein ACRDL5_04935 [Solirubrobacteraceae bacterium]
MHVPRSIVVGSVLAGSLIVTGSALALIDQYGYKGTTSQLNLAFYERHEPIVLERAIDSITGKHVVGLELGYVEHCSGGETDADNPPYAVNPQSDAIVLGANGHFHHREVDHLPALRAGGPSGRAIFTIAGTFHGKSVSGTFSYDARVPSQHGSDYRHTFLLACHSGTVHWTAHQVKFVKG